MYVHVANDEEGALPTILFEMTSKCGSTGFPDSLHVEAEATNVVITFGVDGAEGDFAAILERNCDVQGSSAATFRLVITDLNT